MCPCALVRFILALNFFPALMKVHTEFKNLIYFWAEFSEWSIIISRQDHLPVVPLTSHHRCCWWWWCCNSQQQQINYKNNNNNKSCAIAFKVETIHSKVFNQTEIDPSSRSTIKEKYLSKDPQITSWAKNPLLSAHRFKNWK